MPGPADASCSMQGLKRVEVRKKYPYAVLRTFRGELPPHRETAPKRSLLYAAACLLLS